MISKNQLKFTLSLKNKKIRAREKLFLIEGFRLCYEALNSDFEIENLYLCKDFTSNQQIQQIGELAQKKKIEPTFIDKSDALKIADTVHSQGIFVIIKQHAPSIESQLNNNPNFVIIIDAGQDPGNVGTIIRTCDWFGIDLIILGKGTVDLYNPKVIRSTMGSIFHIPIIEDADLSLLLPTLIEKSYTIYGADVNGTEFYNEVEFKFPVALLIGNENKGIDSDLQSMIDQTIRIPLYGKAESLNMAMAAGIIISRIKN